MSAFQIFPLMTFSLIVYTVITLLGVGNVETANGIVEWYDVVLANLVLVSGDVFKVTWGVVFLVVSMGLLFVELVRATKTGTESLINHVFSIIVFVIGLLLFILVKGYGNTIYFVFLVMLFLDPITGLIVTTVTARRDFSVTDGALR